MSARTFVLERKNALRRALTHAARRLSGRQRIVASLTSYPPRIHAVHVAIQSLLAQCTLPDLIVLYLFEGDFPNREDDLPRELRHQLAHDVRIRWVDRDLKSHKKYFWALQEFSDCAVITFDDDLIYRNTLISDLMASYHSHPDAISASRTHLIARDDEGAPRPYAEWDLEAPIRRPELVGVPSMDLFATSGAGTLFPPHAMPPETFDADAIERTCIEADDVWLKAMQMLAGKQVVAATADQALSYVPDTQDVGLWHDNLAGGGTTSG